MNQQWLHWRSYTATDSLGADQNLVRPVIEQCMLEAIETERGEQRGFFTKLTQRLLAIAGALRSDQPDERGELQQFADLAKVLGKQLADIEPAPPDATAHWHTASVRALMEECKRRAFEPGVTQEEADFYLALLLKIREADVVKHMKEPTT